MIVKAGILDRQNRVLHHRRNLFILQGDALLESELADLGLPVVGIDARDYAGPVCRQGGHFTRRLRIVELVCGDDAGQTTGSQGQQ